MAVVFLSSWDDGHPSDLRVEAAMQRHGFRATYYVPLRNREGLPVMTPAAMRALAQTAELGSHTLNHVYADSTTAAAWRTEVVEGKRALEEVLGRAVQGFCYPGGRVLPDAPGWLAQAGFLHARTTRNACLLPARDAFRIPTTMQCFPHPRSVWWRNFLSQGQWRERWPAVLAASAAPDLEARLHALLDLAVANGGVFHLWGHSWELDAAGLWPLLDRFLAHAARRVPPAQRMSVGEWVRATGLGSPP